MSDAERSPTAGRGGSTGRRIVVLDFCGHPFQVQLSRELAARGHSVLHLYCPDVPSGHGNLANDPALPTLRIEAVSIGEPFQRYDFVKRCGQERRFGRLVADVVVDFAPDVALLSNVPLIAATFLRSRLAAVDCPYVLWHQDIASLAIAETFTDKLSAAGRPFGWMAGRAERALVAGARHVVTIADTFLDEYARWEVPLERVSVVPNWAPIDELPTAERDNAWAAEHDLIGRTVFAYTGTLGLKHNPALLLRVALHLGEVAPDARMLVVSQGTGREWLEEQKARLGLEQLVLLDYQPYERMTEVTGAADVLVAVLEPTAGSFSVPSKVLSYLCAARPVLGLMPSGNLAAHIITGAGAGWVCPPDEDSLIPLVTAALAEPGTRAEFGAAARSYAERTFRIASITDRFEGILHEAIVGAPGRLPRPRRASGTAVPDADHAAAGGRR